MSELKRIFIYNTHIKACLYTYSIYFKIISPMNRLTFKHMHISSVKILKFNLDDLRYVQFLQLSLNEMTVDR